MHGKRFSHDVVRLAGKASTEGDQQVLRDPCVVPRYANHHRDAPPRELVPLLALVDPGEKGFLRHGYWCMDGHAAGLLVRFEFSYIQYKPQWLDLRACPAAKQVRPMNVLARPVDPKKLIRGATGDWEVVIGLEIHAQVTSRSKLFSGASTEFGG